MRLSVSQYAQAIVELSRESGTEARLAAERIVADLRRRRKLKLLPAIVAEAERLEAAARGETRVRVVTREALSRQELGHVAAEAERVFGISKAVLEPEVDPSLGGGIVLETDTHRIDASVKRRLADVRKALRQ